MFEFIIEDRRKHVDIGIVWGIKGIDRSAADPNSVIIMLWDLY
jgi:hypothetical protein